MQPQIIILKEGTETAQGRQQVVSNINACQAIVDAIRTTLGPRGMDKLIVDAKGKATISNDGATIMKLLDVVHPAAKTLVDIAKSQDAEVGDGTTSVVILAGEFLKQCKPFVEEGVHPRVIIKSFRQATQLAVEQIRKLAVHVSRGDETEHRQLLVKCAATAMSSKLIHQQKDFFAEMVVNAVKMLDDLMPLNMIGIKKVRSGRRLIQCFLTALKSPSKAMEQCFFMLSSMCNIVPLCCCYDSTILSFIPSTGARWKPGRYHAGRRSCL